MEPDLKDILTKQKNDITASIDVLKAKLNAIDTLLNNHLSNESESRPIKSESGSDPIGAIARGIKPPASERTPEREPIIEGKTGNCETTFIEVSGGKPNRTM